MNILIVILPNPNNVPPRNVQDMKTTRPLFHRNRFSSIHFWCRWRSVREANFQRCQCLQITHLVSKALQTLSQHPEDVYERVTQLKTIIEQVTFEDIYEQASVLSTWRRELKQSLSDLRQATEKRPKSLFPENFVRFLSFKDWETKTKGLIFGQTFLLPCFTRQATLASCVQKNEVNLDAPIPEPKSQSVERIGNAKGSEFGIKGSIEIPTETLCSWSKEFQYPVLRESVSKASPWSSKPDSLRSLPRKWRASRSSTLYRSNTSSTPCANESSHSCRTASTAEMRKAEQRARKAASASAKTCSLRSCERAKPHPPVERKYKF